MFVPKFNVFADTPSTPKTSTSSSKKSTKVTNAQPIMAPIINTTNLSDGSSKRKNYYKTCAVAVC